MRLITRVLLAACLLAVPSTSLAQLRSELVAGGILRPLAIVPDPLIPGVLYVPEQGGLIRVVRDGITQRDPFLDLRGTIISGGEFGLLGMAFSPDVASGRVFVNFTNVWHHTVIARFERSARNPLVADPRTRLDLLWPTGERLIRKPFDTHHGGHLAFGPDGYLYVGLGDGGGTNDPHNNAQNLSSFLGKILRLDVDVPDRDTKGYRVPGDNPFVHHPGALGEIWSIGFRNPTRFSFDDFGEGATGALIVADVGQSTRQEINYEPAGSGGRNYGWRIREGRIAAPGVPATTAGTLPLQDPIFDYAHTDGQSVTGGVVYRGTRLPARYRGRYFFADLDASRVWSMGLAIDRSTGEAAAVDIMEHTAEFGGSAALRRVAAFARDARGELYFSTYGGRVLRIVSATAGPSTPVTPVPPVTGVPPVPRVPPVPPAPPVPRVPPVPPVPPVPRVPPGLGFLR